MLNRLYSCLSNIEAWVRHLARNKMGSVVHVGSPITVDDQNQKFKVTHCYIVTSVTVWSTGKAITNKQTTLTK